MLESDISDSLYNKDGTNFVRAADAARAVGYTSDYVTKLAREGKICAQLISGKWFVLLESVETFARNALAQKNERRKKLRLERKRERALTSVLADEASACDEGHAASSDSPTSRAHSIASQKVAALLQTAVIVFLGIGVGSTGYLFSGSPETLTATVQETQLNIFERMALSVYKFVSGESTNVVYVDDGVYENTGDASPDTRAIQETSGISHPAVVESDRGSRQAIFVAPESEELKDQIEFIRESFSDDVVVVFDEGENDTGVIIPTFKESEGEAYRFLMVPIVPDNEGKS